MPPKPSVDEIVAAAKEATARQDRVGIEGAWALMRERYPSSAAGYIWGAVYLRDRGEYEAADVLFERGIEQAPDTLNLRIQYAWCAFYRSDWPVALERWRSFIAYRPEDSAGHYGVILTLMRMGRFDDAQAVVDAVPPAIRDEQQIAIARAQLASARQEWQRALELWSELRVRLPDHESVKAGYGRVLNHLSLLALDAGPDAEDTRPPERAEIAATGDESVRSLVTRFESVGDNCEFGLVQRHFGAEPIGLLRWTDVPAKALAEMLEQRFEGLGDPEHTEIMLVAWGEYFLMDRRYGLSFHTWVNEHEGDPKALLVQHSRRLRRLRDELLEMLEEGGRLVVYRARRRLDDEMRDRIFNALQAIGANTLLLVGIADDEHPAGSVTVQAPRLLLGHIEHASPIMINGRSTWDIPFDTWRRLCEAAAAWHDAHVAAVA